MANELFPIANRAGQRASALVVNMECVMPCEGAPGEMCSDAEQNSVIAIVDVGTQLDIDMEIQAAYTYVGCYIDVFDDEASCRDAQVPGYTHTLLHICPHILLVHAVVLYKMPALN